MNRQKRTELTEQRSANRKVFENADHSRTAEIYLDAVHYQDEDGSWKEMDDTLTEEGEGQEQGFSNKKGKFQFKMKKHAKEKGMFTLKDGDVKLSWGIAGAAKSEGVKEDAKTVRFPEILPKTDLVCRNRGEKVKEDLILKEAGAAGFVTYLYEAKGLVAEAGRRSLRFLDGDGKERFRIAAPYMKDAAGEVSEDIRISVEEKGNGDIAVTFTADPEWLQAPERCYPVVLDPVTTTSKEREDIMDAHVDSLYEEDNFYDSYILKTKGGDNIQRSFVKFALPDLKSADMVVKARLLLVSLSESGTVKNLQVHRVLQDWDSSTITWNNKPLYDEQVLDHCRYTASEIRYVEFDITRTVKEWYLSGENYGLMFKDEHELSGYTEFLSSDSHDAYTDLRPRIEISYIRCAGLEDYWSYHSQEAGRAGTVHVNDYNGNLIFVHETMSTGGSLMPAEVEHVYNCCHRKTDLGYGYGFRLNYHQEIAEKTIGGTKYYRHVDGYGGHNYFYHDSEKKIWKDEAGRERELTVASDPATAAEPYVIKDKKDNRLIFDASGRLVKVEDRNGNALVVRYTSGGQIGSILDGAGRELTFTYTDGRLTSTLQPDGRAKTYSYDGEGNLIQVTDADSRVVTFGYRDIRHRLQSVTDVYGRRLEYSYYTSSLPYRVKKISEYGGETAGQSLTFTYGDNRTRVKDHKGRCIYYRFNNSGNLICVHDGKGRALGGRYHTGHANRLAAVTKLQEGNLQLLKDPAALAGTSAWTPETSGSGTCTTDTSADCRLAGEHSLKAKCTDTAGHAYWSQDVELEPGGTYTFSGYAYASVSGLASGGGSRLAVSYRDGTGTLRSVESENLEKSTRGFVRLMCTFTIPEDASSGEVTVRAGVWGMNGWCCFDLLQLEPGDRPGRVNLVENGAFHGGDASGFTLTGDAGDMTVRAGKEVYAPFHKGLMNTEASEPVRTSPAASAGTAAVLAKGTHFSGTGIVKDAGGTEWCHVVLASGAEGYVKRKQTIAYVPGGNSLYAGCASGQGWLLRSDASSSASVAASVPEDACMTVISEKTDSSGGKWYKAGLNIDTQRHWGYLPEAAVIRMYSNLPYGTMKAAGNLFTDTGLTDAAASLAAGDTVYVRGEVVRADGVKVLAVSRGKGFAFLPYSALSFTVEPEMVRVTEELVPEAASGTGEHVYRMAGAPGKVKKLTKELDLAGKSGDTFMVNAWGAGTPLPPRTDDGDRHFGVEAVFVDKDGKEEVHRTDFCTDILDWQFLSDIYVAKKDYVKVKVSYVCSHQANQMFFDGLALYMEEFGQTYTYDEDGNVISVKEAGKDAAEFAYEGSDLTGITDTLGNHFRYVYDGKHNVKLGTSAEGTVYAFFYDSRGNVTESGAADPDAVTGTEGDQSVPSSADGIWITREMTSDRNHVKSVTDGDGNSVSYDWDLAKDRLDAVTDARGNTTRYTYDALGRVKTVSRDVTIQGAAAEARAAYKYSYDRLVRITHNGFDYVFTHDAFGNTSGVTAGGSPLVSYVYGEKNGNLLRTVYGNGAYIRCVYDSDDRLESRYFRDAEDGEESLLDTYVYDKQGNLLSVTDHTSGKSYQMSYDLLDRMMRIRDGSGNISQYSYDTGDRLTKLRHVTAERTASTFYTYDSDGRETASEITGGCIRNTSYDKYGRVSGQQWEGIPATAVTYSYPENGRRLSARPAVMKIGDRRLTYAYDGNGNIVSVTDGSGKLDASYRYDELDQLIREDNRKIGKTFLYTYDAGGNLTGIREYAYTTADTPGTLLKETLGDLRGSGWKDQLVQWDGEALTYDGIGNLLSRGNTRTYRWSRGRRLAAVVKDGTESCYQYDHAGMRVKKTVGTAETEYRYAGRLLLSEKTGSRLQCYHYDASAELIAMSVNGTVYLYVKNLQGDIIGLTDTSGNLVVEYHYDAWGNPAGVTGNKASTVGVQNPFRYRGYYYDNETGMYYVSSRYYDPEIGRFINTDDIDYLGEDGSLLSYNLFAYCMNNPVNRFDINGNWSLPNLAKIAIGAAAIAVGVIATAATGGAAAPVLVASLKIAATSAAIGAVSGAGISAVNHRVSTGSWEGTGKAAVTGAIDGACDGFMWGGITAGATTVALAAKGTYINKIGNLKPTGKSGNGYTGVRYSVKKSSGKLSYKSIELHSPHTGGKHNFWHWQKNQWSYYNKIWSISDKKAKVFTLLGKRVP